MLQILNKKLQRESTTEEVSFEWTHHRITSTNSKVITRFHLNCNAKELHRLTLKLYVRAKNIVPCVGLVLVFSSAE